MIETPKPQPYANRCVNCGMPLEECMALIQAAASASRRKRHATEPPRQCCGGHRHRDADGPSRREREEARRADLEARTEAERPNPLKLARVLAARSAPARTVYSTSSTLTTKET